MLEVKPGTKIKLESSKKRTDGLTDFQEVFATVTKVDDFNAEYVVTSRGRSENVLRPITSGGFSLRVCDTPEKLKRFVGVTILDN
jgi:hypothetical protein